MTRFTRRQWLTFTIVSIADFCTAICASLQAPFYPQEAEKKGCTASEYGLVFGIFELVVFIVSPIYGKYLNKMGVKFTFNGGLYTTGICCILFGFLDKVEGHYPFIILSFVIRIVEALGMAGFMTAVFAIYAKEFPNNVATIFSSLETFFGLGLIAGPSIGGALFQVGGYTLPFLVMGLCLFLSAILTNLLLPKYDNDSARNSEKGPTMWEVLKIPGVFISTASVAATSMSIGFLLATLEPHLRQFNLSPVKLGLVFICNGGTYAITAPGFGIICDRISQPKAVTLVGTILIATAFALVGPVSFIPLETTLWMCILGLVLHGLGLSSQLVPSFSDALRCSITRGLPNNLDTFGLISGLWTSAFALGAFIGPSISGILYDTVGFRQSVLFIIVVHLLLGMMVIVYLKLNKSPNKYVQLNDDVPKQTFNESTKLISTNGVPVNQQSGLSNSFPLSGSYKSASFMYNNQIGIFETYGSLEK